MCFYPKDRRSSVEWRNSRIVFYVIMGSLISTTLVYSVLLTTFDHTEQPVIIFAHFLGYFACTVALFQYLPQIYKTWRTQSVGSLSIVSMSIQTPGALMIVYTQIVQPNSDYTTWLPTLAAAILQGILLVMCLYLQYYCRRSTHHLEELSIPYGSENLKVVSGSGSQAVPEPLTIQIDSQRSSISELNSALGEDASRLEVKPLIKSSKK